jgi:hypothetical protein
VHLTTKCRPSHLLRPEAPKRDAGCLVRTMAMSIANLPRPVVRFRSLVLSPGYIGLLRPVTSLRIIAVYAAVVVLFWLTTQLL